MKTEKLGFAGKLGSAFIHSKLTPVIAISSLLLGLMAVYLTPKEEEPQISVPMIDIRTPAPGFTAEETERKVTEPIERAVWGLDGVEYVYSSSQAHGSLVTVRFKVGEPMEPSLVKIHHKLMMIQSELPKQSLPPQVKSFSIDDVPFMVLTFTSDKLDDFQLRTRVAPLARELSSTPDLARVELLGGRKRSIRVIADPKKMQTHGVSILSLVQALESNDALAPAGKNWGETEVMDVEVGGRLRHRQDVARTAVGQRSGRVVFVEDVAQVIDGPEERVRSSILAEKGHAPAKAVSIVFAKRKGTNVVTLSKELLERAHVFMKEQGDEADLRMTVVRDYGSTASDKSNELIEHLLLATLSVSLLIAIFMGLRASLVVAIAIPVTLALTLAIYYFMGYTLNRVTLFALIFSIGILVDDAIVVVENIERHLKDNFKDGLVKATIRAVNEVGNPTILATFTVIAAILPMAFVRGLMGPYMKPIPVGASFAMILSLFVAFIVTPWAAVKLLKSSHHHKEGQEGHELGRLDRLYQKVMESLLQKRSAALAFGGFSVLLLLLASSLIYFKSVKVKMLPFDNKQEFQVLVDYPTPTSLTMGQEWSTELANEILKHPEVEAVQVFAGEAAPYSFSGMVKHTFLRNQDFQNDLQIVLTEKGQRKASSHEIIESLRPLIKEFGQKRNAVTKVLEIPPGPPVLATMIAEVYGPSRQVRESVAHEIEAVFKNEPSVVDLDTTMRLGRARKIYEYDRSQGGLLGTNARDLMRLGRLVFSETPVGTLSDINAPEDVSIDLSISQPSRSSDDPISYLRVPSFEAGSVEAEQALKNPTLAGNETLFRKNLKPVSYVMSELSGAEEAPVYGILKLQPQIKYPVQTAEVPWNTSFPIIKWDGEWFITYEVFRDLGGAFAVVILLIYILVLGWFRSFTVPLIIMAPIPISLIGILPGHALMGSYFTATSMIGFIAGAGIIVRNSIILVDFIEHQLGLGMDLKEAVVSAGVLRFRPMLLTAAAVVVGSAVMLADPIFQGLAVSLIFGEIAATVLSRFAVPVLYFWFVGKSRVAAIQTETSSEGV
ncbi:MAG: efflux RND transporter permease subunit [Bdellovibrionaceae bacterium]|nr:efflux RND transporter permease subunit [Pseudobdellovibrionaceae bacterium]